MAAAARCYVIADEKGWLDCYYGSAESLRSVLGLAPFQRTRAPDMRTVQLAGKSTVIAPDEEASAPAFRSTGRVVSRIASYSFDWNKIFTVTLANGQTWRQRQGDTTYAHWKKQPDVYLVTITKGALGSFNMKVQGGAGTFKVQRIN